jgi:hypothetical protein
MTPRIPSVARRRETVFFAENDREWVRLKWEKIRTSMQEADRAGNTWNRISAEINEYMDRKGITDPLQRAKVKSESLALKDAFELGQFRRGEARAHMEDLNTYLRLREMGLLGGGGQ